jgi:tRNA(Ile)-lysidine synthase
MASSKKPRNADPAAAAARFLESLDVEGKKLAVGLSGGVDSVVLLHVLQRLQPRLGYRLCAIHVHHGLSPHAGRWAAFCRKLCRELGVPLTVRRVKVERKGRGLEAAARDARHGAFRKTSFDCIALAHQLDDQAETVLMNLLRGAGVRGASGMAPLARLGGKTLLRPFLEVGRGAILAYARARQLPWVEDESNADAALTRNFVRLQLGPLIETRFPAWRASLSRAARHFARRELAAGDLLRAYLREQGLQAPSEARLVEMLRQIASGAPGTRLRHDGATLRVYRGRLLVDEDQMEGRRDFHTLAWRGERRLAIPALHGELRFEPGEGIDAQHIRSKKLVVRLRSGGERLQPDPRRPRRTLKNLFQEAGVPAWERDRLPLLFCGDELVWVAGLGVDARYQGRGLVPQWRRSEKN